MLSGSQLQSSKLRLVFLFTDIMIWTTISYGFEGKCIPSCIAPRPKTVSYLLSHVTHLSVLSLFPHTGFLTLYQARTTENKFAEKEFAVVGSETTVSFRCANSDDKVCRLACLAAQWCRRCISALFCSSLHLCHHHSSPMYRCPHFKPSLASRF